MLGFKALEIAALHAFGDEEGEQKAAAEATFVEAEAELEGAAAVAAEEEKRGDGANARDGFDWKRDFGNPDEMVDGLGAPTHFGGGERGRCAGSAAGWGRLFHR